MLKKFQFYFLIFLFSLLIFPTITFAQLSDDAREQAEAKQEQRQEDLETQKELLTAPKTAEEVMDILKQKAKLKIKEKQRADLLKTRISAGVTSGYESNPANAQDISEKGDSWWEDTFSASWIPKFNDDLSADLGYNMGLKYFFEQNNLSTENHSLNASFKYYPLDSRKLTLEPSFRQEWNIYPYDATSSYEQSKLSMKFTYFLDKLWSTGGKYDYAYKIYDKKAATDTASNNLDFHRADYKNTLELWLKRQVGKYSVKLKGKMYRNNSNNEYQKYDDYDGHDAEISLSGAFLKDNKLYLILTSDFEIKQYHERQGDDATTRADRALQYRLNSYYTINKTLSLNYSFSVKNNSSNKATGEFNDVTNTAGLTINF